MSTIIQKDINILTDEGMFKKNQRIVSSEVLLDAICEDVFVPMPLNMWHTRHDMHMQLVGRIHGLQTKRIIQIELWRRGMRMITHNADIMQHTSITD